MTADGKWCPEQKEAKAVSDMAKNLILWVVIAIVLMSVFNNFTATQTAPRTTAYSDFIEQVRQGQVKGGHGSGSDH
jgi:hypothetical protein